MIHRLLIILTSDQAFFLGGEGMITGYNRTIRVPKTLTLKMRLKVRYNGQQIAAERVRK